MMKKIYFFAFILIISCSTSDDGFEQNSSGLIEEFINQDSDITVEPINSGNFGYQSHGSPTGRGFYFKPLVDIELTAIGGLMAEVGEYKIDILELPDSYSLVISDTPIIFSQNITITNIDEFQYIELDNELLLDANKRYVIRYLSGNHNSVYDVILPNYYITNQNMFLQPKEIEDIELQQVYYAYYSEIDGELYLGGNGSFQHNHLFLRGIVDFKYQAE